MRVLILANNDVGLYKFRKELLERLVSDGNEVYASLPDGDFINSIEKLGCNVIKTKISRHGTNPVEDLKLMHEYSRILNKIQPDIVFTYTVKPNIYGGIMCASKKIPYAANITGLGTAVENRGFLRTVVLNMYKYALRKARVVFFQNKENELFFSQRKIAVGKHKMLPGSGVNIYDHDYCEFPVYEAYHDKFLFAGRIMKDKGVDEYFSAAEKIKKIYPDVTFGVAGDIDGDYIETLKKYEDKGIISCYGFKKDMRPLYRECSAVVLPSYHEGMANVLLEAAAFGRPVLASNIPGCAETFDEGISGLGFKAKDTDSLYEALMNFIMLDNSQKAEMGRNGRKKMESEFNRQMIIDAYINEINSLKRSNGKEN